MVKKIAFYSFSVGISALEYYRIYNPLKYADIQVLNGINEQRVDLDIIHDCDLVLFQREFSSHFEVYKSVMNKARELGKKVVMDLDDDLLALPSDHPDRISNYYASGLPAFLHALLDVDGVTVTTEPLKEAVQKHNPNVWVLPNYIDDQLWDFRQPQLTSPGNPVRILYMGTATHRPDLNLISETLFQLAKSMAEEIEFYFYGINPPSKLEELTKVIHQPVQTFNYENFASYMSQIQADLAIAPLCDNAFNRSKSAIKFLEYTAMGIPGVFADIPPYSTIIVDGYNGLLAQTPEQWHDKIRFLIENPGLRRQIIQNAQKSVQTRWLMKEHASDWLEAYNEIGQSVRVAQVDRNNLLDSLEMVITQQKEIRDKQELINKLINETATQSGQLSDLKEKILELNLSAGRTNNELISLTNKLRLAEIVFAEKNKIIEFNRHAQEELINKVEDLEKKLRNNQDEVDELRNTTSRLLLSKCWTITRPIRKVFRGSKERLG